MKRLLKRIAGSTADQISKLLYDPIYPNEVVRADLAEQLVSRYQELQGAKNGPNAERQWDDYRQRIRQQIIQNSPRGSCAEPIGPLLGLGNSAVAFRAWRYLKHAHDWPRYKRALVEDPVGKPIRFLCMPSTGGCQLHHTSHLCAFEQTSGTRIDQIKLIVEFGGGYGSFCRQIHRLGFTGRYVIFDLPEMLALQKYVLSSLELPVLHPDQLYSDNTGISLLSDLDELRRLVPAMRNHFTPALFAGTWSISEIPECFEASSFPSLRTSIIF